MPRRRGLSLFSSMPNLCIIPLAALQHPSVRASDLRVLCAIGSHTDKLGGNVWASVETMAREARVSERQFQYSVARLAENRFIRVLVRPGKTNIYEVMLNQRIPKDLGERGADSLHPPAKTAENEAEGSADGLRPRGADGLRPRGADEIAPERPLERPPERITTTEPPPLQGAAVPLAIQAFSGPMTLDRRPMAELPPSTPITPEDRVNWRNALNAIGVRDPKVA